MAFLLSSDNVVEYLISQGLCQPEGRSLQIEAKEYKNFNLLVSFERDRHFLVKQERYDSEGNTSGDLENEWLIHQFLEAFPRLESIQKIVSEAVFFDSSNSILVLNYLPQYSSLSSWYRENHEFPSQLATALGKSLAQIHRLTWQQQEYREFLNQNIRDGSLGKKPHFLYGLERIGPGVFAQICTDGIEFFKLYQCYPSLHRAVVQLYEDFEPCCLTHNDLRLSNILVSDRWEKNSATNDSATFGTIKLIDWEFFNWGDPAFDLGILISGYLKLWLDSLYVNNAIDLETSLRLARIPLEMLQPSLEALLIGYLTSFSPILKYNPHFLKKALQFAGLALIEDIQADLEYHEPFSNQAICTLQVAKSLLSYPEKSLPVVTGKIESELISACSIAA